MSFDLASQLLGSAKGHALNVTVDGLAEAALNTSLAKFGVDFGQSTAAKEIAALGFAPTLAGVVEMLDTRLDAAITASGLSDAAKTDIKAVIDNLFKVVESTLPSISL